MKIPQKQQLIEVKFANFIFAAYKWASGLEKMQANAIVGCQTAHFFVTPAICYTHK